MPALFAGTVSWTDWTSKPDGSTVLGIINWTGGSVDVTYTGNLAFAQISGGANYWVPSGAYLSSTVQNAPPASDIIAIFGGANNLIQFSTPVMNPVMAWVSVNGPGVTFDRDFAILSSGCGYFGCGTFQKTGLTLSTIGGGEGHGVIQFLGLVDTIGFSSGNEYWRGFQIGLLGDDQVTGIPEPSSWALLLSGAALVLGLRRRNAI